MYLAKTYRCGLEPWLSLDVSNIPTLQLTKRPETHAFLQFSLQTSEACGILTILGQDVMGFHSQHSVNTTVNATANTAKTLEKPDISRFSSKKAELLHFILKNV